MDIMDMVLSAKTSSRKPHFEPGNYVVIVDRLLSRPSEMDPKVGVFTVECTVEQFQPVGDTSPTAFAKGSPVGQTWTTNNQYAGKNINDLMVGIYKCIAAKNGLNPNTLNGAELNKDRVAALLGPEGLAAGVRIAVAAVPKEKAKKKGEFYNVFTWSVPQE